MILDVLTLTLHINQLCKLSSTLSVHTICGKTIAFRIRLYKILQTK